MNVCVYVCMHAEMYVCIYLGFQTLSMSQHVGAQGLSLCFLETTTGMYKTFVNNGICTILTGAELWTTNSTTHFDGSEIRQSPVEVGNLSHYLQDFIDPRWYGTSSSSSTAKKQRIRIRKAWRRIGLISLMWIDTVDTRWYQTVPARNIEIDIKRE